MKYLLLIPLAFSLTAASLIGETEISKPASPEPITGAMLKVGEIYQLETSAPLIDGPDRVTVLGFGPKSWVLVEYEASVLIAGELKPTNRKGQMWVNFDHVVAARKLPPPPAQ